MYPMIPVWVRRIEGADDAAPADTAPTNNDDSAVASEEEQPDPVEKWKKHSRTWENRAKQSEKNLEKAHRDLDDLRAQLEQRPSDDDLTGVRTELESVKAELEEARTMLGVWAEAARQGADVYRAMDSVSFRDAVSGLSLDAEDFPDRVADALGKLPSQGPRFSGDQPVGNANRGVALFERIHGASK